MGLKSHIVRTKRITKLVYISIPTLMLLSGLILNPVTVSHEEASAATGTATAATTSLTLSSSNNSANVAITPKSVNGSFAMSSAAGEAQFNVTTNNYTGYELSIVADDDSGNLTNTDGNVGHSIFSIDTPMTKDSFDTTTYNNRWGYKPSKYVSNNTVIDNTGDSAMFLPSPTTTGTILDHTTVANSSANNYSIALGVRADYNTYAGSYTKNFTLAAIANPTTYIIDYNKNTSDTVTNMPTAQSSATSATSITLASNTPERDGYNFLGWCTIQTTDNTCSGTTYQPGDTYGLDQTTANTTTLYAMWEFNVVFLQDVDLATCSTSPMTAVDLRDGESYTIQKLADGKCWLLDNLRLDLVNISLADLQGKTNASNTTLNYLKNGGGTYSDQYARNGVTNWTSSYDTSSPLVTIGGQCTSGSNNCVNDPSSGQWTKDSLLSYGNGTGKIGAYYNYCAASAGSYCYDEYSDPSGSNVIEDICPAGWRMPTSGLSGEYQALYVAYSGDAIYYDTDATNFKNAFHAPLSGYIENGLAYQKSYGYFWSVTPSGASDRGAFYVGSDYGNASSGTYRKRGISVRCILDPPVAHVISYNKNTTDTVSGMPSTQNNTANSITPIEIVSNVPTRSGYLFGGWCDVQPTTLNGADSCSGFLAQPGGIYYANSDSSVTLYAMWTSLAMQDVTLDSCPAIPTSVYDARDNEVYTIQKLADNKCWLLDNLRTDLVNVSLSALQGRTNASNATLNYLKNGGGDIAGQYATAGVVETTSDYGYNPLITTGLKDQILHFAAGQLGASKIGTYYNYCAASAGSYCYSGYASVGDATEDVCPAGWRMPTGGRYVSEYHTLVETYGGESRNINLVNAFRIVLVGSSGSEMNRLSYIWALSRDDERYMQNLSVYNSGDFQFSNTSRANREPVRCILDQLSYHTITYNKNTTDTVSNLPTTQVATTNSIRNSVALLDVPNRSGYAFAGWCDTQPTTSNGVDSCSGTRISPGEKYVINPDSSNITLYAMWEIFPSLAIQNITASTCPTTPTRVYDVRDNEIYTIQKLADGKCWLLDNLRLDLTNATVKTNLSAGNTNASNATLNYLKNGGGTTSDQYATAGATNWFDGYGYTSSFSVPLIVISGVSNNGDWAKDTLQSYGSGSSKIGIYYNFCAASAGSYCYGNGTSAGSPSGNATEDICPKGWRMPTGEYSSGEYSALYAAYSSNATNFKNALRTPLSGYFKNSMASGQSSSGYFWSSTYGSSSYMYSLDVYSSVNPQYTNNRNYGLSVRCVSQ